MKKNLIDLENALPLHLLACDPVHIAFGNLIQGNKGRLPVEQVEMNTDRLRPGVFENTDRLVNFVLLDVVDALKAGLELDPDCPAVANYFQIRTGTAPEGFDIFQIILADGIMLAISTEKTLAKTGVKNSDTA